MGLKLPDDKLQKLMILLDGGNTGHVELEEFLQVLGHKVPAVSVLDLVAFQAKSSKADEIRQVEGTESRIEAETNKNVSVSKTDTSVNETITKTRHRMLNDDGYDGEEENNIDEEKKEVKKKTKKTKKKLSKKKEIKNVEKKTQLEEEKEGQKGGKV